MELKNLLYTEVLKFLVSHGTWSYPSVFLTLFTPSKNICLSTDPTRKLHFLSSLFLQIPVQVLLVSQNSCDTIFIISLS